MRIVYLMIIVGLLTLLLTGCADKLGVYLPTEVKVPVATSCNVEIPKEPEYHVDSLVRVTSMPEKIKAIIADNELKSGYIVQLKAALNACHA